MEDSAQLHALPSDRRVDRLRPSPVLGAQRCPHSGQPTVLSRPDPQSQRHRRGLQPEAVGQRAPPRDTGLAGQSLISALLAWCSNPRSTGHGWLATGLLAEGRCRPGPGNHTLTDLLIPPDLGRLSPSWQQGARNRSCGLGKRVDEKEKWPHFVQKGKGSPKPHALGQSAAHLRAVSSWKLRDTTRLTLCKYPPPLANTTC